MDCFMFLSFFFIGTIFGSFYYVCAYRIPKGESIVYPPSHCPKCNHRLGSLELIPIFSYLFQLGKCKNCGDHISIFYPLFEIASGLLFGFSYLSYGLSLELIIVLIFVSMVLIIMLSDYYYMIIPDSILIFASISIMISMFFIHDYQYLFSHILGGVFSFLTMYGIKLFGDFIFKKESMGGGDIKLMFVFGLVFGYPMAIISIFIASFIGLPISLLLLKKDDSHVLPFGPYLGMASLIIILFQINFDMVIKFITR